MEIVTLKQIDKFLSRKFTKIGDCWILGGTNYIYKSVAYFIEHKEYCEAIDIYNTCRNKRCFNPKHLQRFKREEVKINEHLNANGELFGLFMAMDHTKQAREGYARSPFGYAGSKDTSLKHILPHLPYRKIYAEVFGGSGAVLLARDESPLEIFNDRYSGVVCFYRVLRDENKLKELMERIELTIHSREEFNWCKNTWENVDDDVERAARWFYLNQISFAKQGRCFGRAIRGKGQHGGALRNSLQWFEPCHNRLRNVQIENLDWKICLKDFDTADTVFYLDPPYLKYGGGMYDHVMNRDDHIELLERIFTLEGFVALSGYGDEHTKALYGRYQWDNIIEWETACNVIGLSFSDTANREGMEETIKRGTAKEMLFIKE